MFQKVTECVDEERELICVVLPRPVIPPTAQDSLFLNKPLGLHTGQNYTVEINEYLKSVEDRPPRMLFNFEV